ncbi:MAG: HAMP domain-containing protein [Rhodocyclaceae bacterium]|nr:HAMP domain-containing protein [Rhodocyclaceae bacterium]
MRVAILVSLGLGAILLFLLAGASANSPLFARHYAWLLGANAVLALGLLTLVGARLLQLRREYRAGVFGSRLKVRLLLMLGLMAVLPGALVYGVSMQFAVKSIESWFDVRVDNALEGGLALGRSVLEAQQADLLDKGRSLSLELGDTEFVTPPQMSRLRERVTVMTLTLFSSSGQALVSATADDDNLLPQLPTLAQLRQARQGRGIAMTEGEASEGLTVRALVPVYMRGGEVRVLQLTDVVPVYLAGSAASVEDAYRDYQELQLGKEGLKRIYTMTLTLTLLLALFAAMALAFTLAERLAEPLLLLAEGTQAVAAGDYTPRAAIESNDELGILTRSFNQMTRQLDDARRETERHRAATEAARAYLESVLGNLSAGVITFDNNFVMRAANLGAVGILHSDLTPVDNIPLMEWPIHRQLCDAVLEGFRENPGDWQKEVEIDISEGMAQTLLLRGTTLPASSGAGHVIVFDDVTDLISAQRTAAWGEVARRLAHEIKNPLTPIQLSAERLQLKLADKLAPPEREMLERASSTIVNQVEALKNLVNEFRDYARTPPPELKPVDLNDLVRDVLGLYENAAVRIEADLAPELPLVSADANQMRQVIHNLLRNAQDALGDIPEPRLAIATRADPRGGTLTVSDNGSGFPPQILARAFEPYVTTKAKGTGLGLAIVKKIIDDHKGEIRISNRESGGAVVTIRLPLATVDS